MRVRTLFFALTLSACVDPSSLAGFGCTEDGVCSGDAGAGGGGGGADGGETCASAACGENAACRNVQGGYECRCADGYSGAVVTGAPAHCVDVDECVAGVDCGVNAACHNTPGTYECACVADTFGTTTVGRPTTCTRQDPCVTASCGAHASCASSGSSWTCACDPGFAGTTVEGGPATCVDIDECAAAGRCGPNTTCVNTSGSFECGCVAGWTGAVTQGSPASCADVDECDAGVACGANARCMNGPGSYGCLCAPGFFGAFVDGGPTSCMANDPCVNVTCGAGAQCTGGRCECLPGFATGTTGCVDVDECSMPGRCGANAVCTNTAGSYGCTCVAGFAGTPTSGMPATCRATLVELGLGLTGRDGGAGPIVVQLTAPAAVGTRLVVVVVQRPGVFGFSAGSPVSDSRGNSWRELESAGGGGFGGQASANAVLWTAVVTVPLQVGDTVSVSDSLGSGVTVGAWVAALPAHASVDSHAARSLNATTAPSVSVAAVHDEAVVIGSLFTRAVVDVVPQVATPRQRLRLDAGSWLVTSEELPRSDAGATLRATAASAQSFVGVLGTFHALPPRAPTALALTHTANARTFTVSWQGGVGTGGVGGCSIQYQAGNGTWRTAGLGNCDVNTTGQAVALSAAGSTTWYGGAWSSAAVRLVRVDDGVVLATFSQPVTCTPRGASTTSTTGVDEDCDGAWDDFTCMSWAWVAGAPLAPPNAPCSSTSAAASQCTAAEANNTRYTVPSTLSPAMNVSSSSYGASCAMNPDAGVLPWTCTGSGCSYF